MSGVDLRVHVASHQVRQESDLEKVASKAPRAVVVIPELADEESPEGWQVLGETPNRVEASVRELLGKALHDLQHEIPESLREHPAVKHQCSKLQDLLSCKQHFGIELRDMADEDGAVPAWVETFLEGGDPRDHAASEWKDPMEDLHPRAADEPAELGSPASLKRCVIAPGNGCSPIQEANWYSWLAQSLNRKKLLQEEVVLRDFPDPWEAKREIWLKFMKEALLGATTTGGKWKGGSHGGSPAARRSFWSDLTQCQHPAALGSGLDWELCVVWAVFTGVKPWKVLVGHSSGAQAAAHCNLQPLQHALSTPPRLNVLGDFQAMRLAEEEVIGGLVLVVIWETQESALLDTTRQKAGRGIGSLVRSEGRESDIKVARAFVTVGASKTGTLRIAVQLHSTDDPLVPVSEGRVVAEERSSKVCTQEVGQLTGLSCNDLCARQPLSRCKSPKRLCDSWSALDCKVGAEKKESKRPAEEGNGKQAKDQTEAEAAEVQGLAAEAAEEEATEEADEVEIVDIEGKSDEIEIIDVEDPPPETPEPNERAAKPAMEETPVEASSKECPTPDTSSKPAVIEAPRVAQFSREDVAKAAEAVTRKEPREESSRFLE
ncbi:Rbbp9, partial [Symbiodinium necroappetens]